MAPFAITIHGYIKIMLRLLILNVYSLLAWVDFPPILACCVSTFVYLGCKPLKERIDIEWLPIFFTILLSITSIF